MLDKAGRKNHEFERSFQQAGKRGREFGISVKGLATSIAGSYAVIKATEFLKVSVERWEEHEKAVRQTAAVLKSTADASGETEASITRLSDTLERKNTVDRDVIRGGLDMELTFKGIRNEAGKGNDIFNQTAQVTEDMAAAMAHGAVTADSLQASTIQVGKALSDPIAGLTALRRVGVTFDEGQKKQIKTLVEHGHKLEAEKVILKELSSEFSGSAAAQATAGGKLSIAYHHIEDAIGKVLLPAVEKAASWLADRLPAAEKTLEGALRNGKKWWDDNKDAVEKLGKLLHDVFVPDLQGAGDALGEQADKLKTVRGFLDRVTWAAATTAKDFLLLERAVLIVGKAFDDIAIAAGYTINFLDRLRGGSGHAADAMVADARKERDHITSELGTIDRKLKETQRIIDGTHGKTVSVSVQGTVHWDKNAALLKQLTGNFSHKLPAFQQGGRIPGYGGGDRHLIAVEGGEAVVRKDLASRPDFAAWAAKQGIPGYAAGGLVDAARQVRPLPPASADALFYASRSALTGASRLHGLDAMALLGGAVPSGVSASVAKVAQWTAMVLHQAAAAGAWARRLMFESGGNWSAVNRTDINWQQGHPSVGGAQVIRGTYAAYAGPYRNVGPFLYGVSINPYANSYAGANYATHDYGSMAAVDPRVRPIGYDAGYGVLPPGLSLSWNGLGRPETLGPARRGGDAYSFDFRGALVGDEHALVRRVRDGIRHQQRREGVPAAQQLR